MSKRSSRRSFRRHSSVANVASDAMRSSRHYPSRFRATNLSETHRTLSRFRQLTPLRILGTLNTFRTRKLAKLSSNVSKIPLNRIHQYMDAKGVERLRQSLPSKLDSEKICKDRKSRREVLFAKGLTGSRHRTPTYTVESLVRC